MTQAAVETDLQLEVVADRKELLRGLVTVIDVVERKTTIPILTNLLMEASPDGFLSLTATDLDQSICTRVPVQTRCEGRLTVPARKFYEYVKLLTNDSVALLGLENHWLQIKCGRSRTKMIGMRAEQFPQIPSAAGPFVSLDPDTLRTMVHLVLPCVSNEESRYTLNGALLEMAQTSIAMVATDGHRLARAKISFDGIEGGAAGRFIIPAGALKELRKLLDEANSFELYEEDKTLFFRVGETLLTSRKITGQFPNYQAVIPTAQKTAIVLDTAVMAGIVGRCLIFAASETKALAVKLSEKQLQISAACADVGASEEALDVFGGPDKETTVGFNGEYLKDLFARIPGNVELHVKDAGSPALFIWRNDSGVTLEHVVMPMALGVKK